MFGHQWVPSSYIGKLPNTEIGWEISNIFNIGFDLGFFNVVYLPLLTGITNIQKISCWMSQYLLSLVFLSQYRMLER